MCLHLWLAKIKFTTRTGIRDCFFGGDLFFLLSFSSKHIKFLVFL